MDLLVESFIIKKVIPFEPCILKNNFLQKKNLILSKEERIKESAPFNSSFSEGRKSN